MYVLEPSPHEDRVGNGRACQIPTKTLTRENLMISQRITNMGLAKVGETLHPLT